MILLGRKKVYSIIIQGCLLLGMVVSLATFAPVAHADTTLGFCQTGGGATCKEVFPAGSQGQPITNIMYGPGNTSLEYTLRAYLYSGTGDNLNYMLFRMTVTLTPDPSARRINWITAGPDYSVGSDYSTLYARLWSVNTRADCLSGQICQQMNDPGLEKQNFCEANGGSQSLSIGQDVGKGVTIGWSLSAPTYNWCYYSPSTDQWSQYYDYTLQDPSQAQVRISQDFIFAQWEPASLTSFRINYLVGSRFEDPAPKIPVDGPITSPVGVVYNI